MRVLPKTFLDLESGLARARALNQQLQAEWKPRVSAWHQSAEQTYARQWAEYEQATADWGEVQRQVRPRRVLSCALLALAFLLACPGLFFFGVGRAAGPAELLDIFLLALITAFVLGLAYFGARTKIQADTLESETTQRLQENPHIAFDPRRPRTLPNPMPPKRPELPQLTELTGLWWKHIEAEAARDRTIVKEGDAGEFDLLDELKRILPNSYFAVRGLKIKENFDTDIVLFGPTGIWNLESKYYSGEITFANNRWRRRRLKPGKNGKLPNGEEALKDFHIQWQDQINLIYKYLKRAMPGWPFTLQGGLVFTLPDAVLKIDPDCPVAVDKTDWWIKKIRAAQPEPAMTEAKLLEAADVLLTISHSNKSVPYRSSVKLAEVLYQQQVEQLEQFAAALPLD